jgi:hypothetical protein
MASPTIETIIVNPLKITEMAVSSVIYVTFTSAITETNINNMLTLRDRNLANIPNVDLSFSIFTKTSDNSGKYWIGNVFVYKNELYYPEAEILGSYNNVYLVAKLHVDTVTTFTYTNKLIGPRNETMLAYYKPCYEIKRINKQIVNVFDENMEYQKCSIFGINEKTYETNPNPNVVIPFGYNIDYNLYNKQGVSIVTNGVGNRNEGFGSVVANIYTYKFSVGFVNYTIAYNKHNDLLLNIIKNALTQWTILIKKPDVSKFLTESDYNNYSLLISFKMLDLDDSNDNVISTISTNYGTEFGSIFPLTSEIIIKNKYLTSKENNSGEITSSNNINSITNYIKRSIGNVLGIGHYWYLSTSPLSYDGLNNKYYSGTNGFNQYKIMMSSLLDYNGRLFGMPIEDNNENSIFIEEGKEGNLSSKVTLNGFTHPGLDKEIMTNWVDSVYYVDGLLTSLPISNVTLGLLEDIGYDVCYNKVDIYTLPTITNIDYEIYITYDSSINIFERLTDTYIKHKNKFFIKMSPNATQSDINKLFSDYVNTVINNSESFPINELTITHNSSIEAEFLNIDGNSIEILNNIDTDVENNTRVYKLTTIRQSDGLITALLDKQFYKYDVTPPIIVLKGDSIVNHEINTTYIDSGATASDNSDGDITNNIIVEGDIINTSIVGSYTVTYNIVDYNNNVAIQKIRIVNVIDTINPVVVLVDSAEITLTNGAAYIEYGATASDNSLEVLTVSITGTVDSGVVGDYTVTYTATDSTGNTHTISRLIHVVYVDPYTLQWDNPETDIYMLVDSYSHFSDNKNTENVYNKTVGDSFLLGEYKYFTGSAAHFRNVMKNVFNNGDSIYSSMSGTGNYISHLYGGVILSNFAGGTDIPYDTKRYGTGDYNGVAHTGTYNGLVYYNHVDYVSLIDYAGEFLETIFPFYVDLTSFNIESYNAEVNFTPKQSVLMGSTDFGVTYQMIEVFNDQSPNYSPIYSNLPKYNALKYIVTKCTEAGYVMSTKNIRLYGKIYSKN